MKLIEYLPDFMQELRELKELYNTEDIEVKKINDVIENIFTEVIIKTAESYGLERYEKIYGLADNSDNIETRRFKILSKILNKVPYSYNWINNKLKEILGNENYKININYDEYKINIEIAYLFHDIAETLYDDLRPIIPANMELKIELVETDFIDVAYSGVFHIADVITI